MKVSNETAKVRKSSERAKSAGERVNEERETDRLDEAVPSRSPWNLVLSPGPSPSSSPSRWSYLESGAQFSRLGVALLRGTAADASHYLSLMSMTAGHAGRVRHTAQRVPKHDFESASILGKRATHSTNDARVAYGE